MTGRSRQILGRLPAHLDATRSGKQLEAVTDALASILDTQSAQLARVRKSHRLADADELTDLLLIAARHGLTRGELDLAFTRWSVAAAVLDALGKAATEADRDKLAAQLTALWGIDAAAPVLASYAPPANGGAPDLNAARTRLLSSAAAALSRASLLDAVRARVAATARIHALGNGTVRAVIEGAANALDLDLASPISHSADRYWHAAIAHDRATLTHPLDTPASGGKPATVADAAFAPAREVVGIEENPLERNTTDPVARRHAELFSVIRRGFDRVLLQIRVTGKEQLTVGPMVVNRDEGHGVGYALAVPSGETLVFTEEGRALLDNSDVTSFAYAWKGACFAGSDARPADFVFDAPTTVFAVATPAGALDPDFNFPHSGESLPMPGLAVGETRLAWFIQQAYYSNREDAPPALILTSPRPKIGFLDNSVFAPGPDETAPQSGLVSLSWLEHRAFCIRVLIPRRFRGLTPDDGNGVETLQRVEQALERFRPAGVEVRVEFTDDRWVLGQGVLVSGASDDPIAQLMSGTDLWEAPPS